MSRQEPFLAKTFHGLEDILADELRDLGATRVQPIKRAVRFEGDKELLYKANLWCRTALRILVPIHTFQARNEDQLYKGVQQIPWQKYLEPPMTMAVDAVVKSDYFRHSHYAALKTKDAIVDQLRRHLGKRPPVDTQNPSLKVHLHINQEQVRILLDSSGESLHRRGYREQGGRAPLSEVLAAGMIKLSGWTADKALLDPMCGSGTLPIEAALIGLNIAPGSLGREFGFQKWRDFDTELWQDLLAEADLKRVDAELNLVGRDIVGHSLRAAANNAERAGVEQHITYQQANFLRKPPPHQIDMLIMNPPYGERLGDEDRRDFYRAIGDRFKQMYTGADAWIITSNVDSLKSLKLRPSKKLTLYNGPLLCKFYHYELYQGTREKKKLEANGEMQDMNKD